MAIFNALLNLRELKELYSGKPVCVCPLYKGVINTTKTFEATGNPIVLPEFFKVSQISIPSLRSENTFFTNGENMDIIYKESSFWSDEA